MLPNHFIIQAMFVDAIKTLQTKNSNINYFVVPPEEDYAANVLPINNKIMLSKGCLKTKSYIQQFYPSENIFEVDTSQVNLVDGSLTCSNLLFY